jgi:hypothetical protein
MTQQQELARLAEDITVALANLPGPQAVTGHLMHCTEPDCRICRGCAALLSGNLRWIN